MKNIIVPTDFSETASHALDFAIDFNSRVKGKIVLIHVLESPSHSFSLHGGDQDTSSANSTEVTLKGEFLERVGKQLATWAQRVRKAGQEVDSKICYGNPYQNISDEVTKSKADWVIMGSKGASGLSEIFIGSNAERVVRYVKCPVFVVKGSSPVSNIKKIILASDLSEEQSGIASKAKWIQTLLDSELHIVKVITPHDAGTIKEIQDQLKTFAKENDFKKYTLNTTEADYIDVGVFAFAERIKADLIIMGTHGRVGLAHLLVGSKTEDLVNRSTIPVLSFKIS